jgi:hypothetical protein
MALIFMRIAVAPSLPKWMAATRYTWQESDMTQRGIVYRPGESGSPGKSVLAEIAGRVASPRIPNAVTHRYCPAGELS